MSDANTPGEAPPLTGAILWIAGLVLALANFMTVLDTTIANVSVPDIAGGLAVSPSQGTWVITSYAVAEAITVPLTGWLALRFGTVKLFVGAMIVFGIFSALCGLAPSLGVLVVFRVGQGLAGGVMIPLSQTLLRRIFPPHLQPMAIGLWAMTTVVGPVVGPLLGGYLVDAAGWPWVFYINVPVAMVTAFFAWRLLATYETGTQRRPVDTVGLGLLVLWIGAMQIMLDKGKDLDWFSSPTIIVLALVAVVGLAAFLIWELTADDPVVDLRVFRHRGFAAPTLVMCLVYGTFFSNIVLIPLWLQTSMGYTATWAGRVIAFQGLSAVIFSVVVARLVPKIDSRALVSFGVMVLAGVAFWRAGFTTDINFLGLALPQLVLGAALPFFFVPLTSLALGSVGGAEVASAAGLMNFARTTSGAFAVSITTTAWEDTSSQHHSDLGATLNAPGATLDTLIRHGLNHDQAIAQIDRLVQTQAVMLATDHIFLISAGLFVLAAMVVWLTPKPLAIPAPGAGGH